MNIRSGLWPLYMLTVASPFFAFSLLNVAGKPVGRPDWIGVYLIVAIFFFRWCLRKTDLKSINAIGRAALFLLAAATISMTTPLLSGKMALIKSAISPYAQYILMFLLFIILSNYRATLFEIKTFIRIWLLTAVVVAVYAIYQVFARKYGLPFDHLTFSTSVFGAHSRGGTFEDFTRPSSFLPEPTYLAAYIIPPIIIASLLLMSPVGRGLVFKPAVLAAILLCLLSALILSFSMAGYAFFLFVLAIFFLRTGTFKIAVLSIKTHKKIAAGMVAGLLMILFFPGLNLSGAIVERMRGEIAPIIQMDIESVQTKSAGVRLLALWVTLNVGIEHPLIGVGLGNIGAYSDRYVPAWYTYREELSSPHNAYVQAFAEMGLLGFFASIFLFITALRTINSAMKQSRPDSLSWLLLNIFWYVIFFDLIRGISGSPMHEIPRWFDLAVAGMILNNLGSLAQALDKPGAAPEKMRCGTRARYTNNKEHFE